MSKLSLNNTSVHKKFNESRSTQTCTSCDICRNKNRERRAQSSRCRKQQMSWTHVQICKVSSVMVHEGTKRPSYSNVATQNPNISLGSWNYPSRPKQKKAKVHSARVLLLRHREEDTTDDPVRAYENRRHDNQHKVSMCPRTFRARNVPLPVLGGHSRKTQQSCTRARTLKWHNL